MKIHHQNLCGNKEISCLLQYITYGHSLVTFLYAYKNWKVKKKIKKFWTFIVSGISWVCHGQSLSIVVENTRLKNSLQVFEKLQFVFLQIQITHVDWFNEKKTQESPPWL